MRFIYGTGNEAKIQMMKEMLSPLQIEIVGIKSLINEIPEIDESGNNPLENAIIKAKTYYDILQAPVFSCDSGLFIDELDETHQPGVHVRNINGKCLSDDEMIEYYSSIAKKCGSSCHAIYRNAICLVYDNKHIFKHIGDDISGEKFIITSTPHKKRINGFPLDSLSVHIDSGKYYFDLDKKTSSNIATGFQNIFSKIIDELDNI